MPQVMDAKGDGRTRRCSRSLAALHFDHSRAIYVLALLRAPFALYAPIPPGSASRAWRYYFIPALAAIIDTTPARFALRALRPLSSARRA